MGRAFRIYARGQERGIVEYIETHTTEDVERRFGYKWWATIKPWYDEHKGKNPLSIFENSSFDTSSPSQKIVSAVFAHYDKLQDEIGKLQKQLAEQRMELDYLRKLKKDGDLIEWGDFRELYEYCEG